MTKTRIRYLLQILFAFAITAIGVFQMFARTEGRPPATALVLMGVIAVLFIVTWALICKFQPYANQSIMACVLMLTSIGILMIARCDAAMGTSVATRQMIWLCIALVC